jgi:hypothetical protein
MGTDRSFGSIRKLLSGRFQARYVHLGRRISADSTFATKADATTALPAMPVATDYRVKVDEALLADDLETAIVSLRLAANADDSVADEAALQNLAASMIRFLRTCRDGMVALADANETANLTTVDAARGPMRDCGTASDDVTADLLALLD